VSPIIAVLLAMAMAIFPIAMPRAADQMATVHGLQIFSDHGSHHAEPCQDGSEGGAAHHHGENTGCCGMGACHVFQVTSVQISFLILADPAPLGIQQDAQVGMNATERVDRPPRLI
jgi:hypothetical protein